MSHHNLKFNSKESEQQGRAEMAFHIMKSGRTSSIPARDGVSAARWTERRALTRDSFSRGRPRPEREEVRETSIEHAEQYNARERMACRLFHSPEATRFRAARDAVRALHSHHTLL